jgi:hypothetical protein
MRVKREAGALIPRNSGTAPATVDKVGVQHKATVQQAWEGAETRDPYPPCESGDRPAVFIMGVAEGVAGEHFQRPTPA